MLKTVRLRSHFCDPESVLLQTVRERFTKGETMKRIMREQKQCFGALLETKKEKTLRLRRKKLPSISTEIESNRSATRSIQDSELPWMMRVSEERLRKIRIVDESENSENDGKWRIGGKTLDSAEVQRDKKLGGTVKPLWLPRSSKRIIQCSGDQRIPRECAPRSVVIRKRMAVPSVRLKSVETGSQGRKVPEKIAQGRKVPEKIAQGRRIPEKIAQGRKVLQTVSRAPTILETVLQDRKIPESFSEGRGSPKTVSQGCGNPETVSEGRKDTETGLESRNVVQTALQDIKAAGTDPQGRRVAGKAPQGRNLKDKAPQDPKLRLEQSDSLQYTDIAPVLRADSDTTRSCSPILSISIMDNPRHVNLPSVTRILNATMSVRSKEFLELWAARMIATMGQEAFNEYRRNLFESGKLFHHSIDCMLRKLPFEVPETIEPSLRSIASVVEEVEEVRALESHVVHDELRYRGVIDCVALFRGKLCVIDWKKTDKMKYTLHRTYDAPVQLASYIGALNADKNYPFEIKSGLLAIAHSTGLQSTVFELDETQLQFYWSQWLKRLERYYAMHET